MAKKIKFREDGQAMVEFALTIGIFLLIVFFIIDFGWIAYQKIAFEHGCTRASWYLTAEDLKDEDLLEEKTPEKIYEGTLLETPLLGYIKSSFWGCDADKLSISNAQATLYNKDKDSSAPKIGEVSNYTRYMDLNATVKYKITPLTPLFSMLNIFPNDVEVVKNIKCTRVVATAQRTN